jgi:hypothetical protein
VKISNKKFQFSNHETNTSLIFHIWQVKKHFLISLNFHFQYDTYHSALKSDFLNGENLGTFLTNLGTIFEHFLKFLGKFEDLTCFKQIIDSFEAIFSWDSIDEKVSKCGKRLLKMY